MSVLLRWITPDSNFGWTHTRVYRSTTESGVYTELTDTEIKDYVASTGVPIASSEACDTTGTDDHFYKIKFYDNVNIVISDYSDAVQSDYLRGYLTLEEARGYTNLQEAEYNDRVMQAAIDGITLEINSRTNRTWQGVQTVTDQYLDGDGTDSITLPKGDITSITTLEVDDDGDGTYTSISSSHYFLYADEGIIALKSTSPIRKFPDKRKCVKITYLHGISAPTYEVKNLALLMLMNFFRADDKNSDRIKDGIRSLARHNFTSV